MLEYKEHKSTQDTHDQRNGTSDGLQGGRNTKDRKNKYPVIPKLIIIITITITTIIIITITTTTYFKSTIDKGQHHHHHYRRDGQRYMLDDSWQFGLQGQ
jgi:hypothetical protein